MAYHWPLPRHKWFEHDLRRAAAAWFRSRRLATHRRMAYCLANWHDWPANMILDEVAGYVRDMRAQSEAQSVPFPLHKYIHHGLSSQAMAFNLVGPLIVRGDLTPLHAVMDAHQIEQSAHVQSASFEYEDRKVFNEDTGQPTSIDIVLRDASGEPTIFIESKLVEREFGGCSVFAGGDCDGRNPSGENRLCYLHFLGRRYWELMERYGFSELLAGQRQCVFTTHYQFFREVLLSLDKGGVFVLLSDERSPVFHCRVGNVERGLMPALIECVPAQHRSRIVSISVQELVRAIAVCGRHADWIGEFEAKYGM